MHAQYFIIIHRKPSQVDLKQTSVGICNGFYTLVTYFKEYVNALEEGSNSIHPQVLDTIQLIVEAAEKCRILGVLICHGSST